MTVCMAALVVDESRKTWGELGSILNLSCFGKMATRRSVGSMLAACEAYVITLCLPLRLALEAGVEQI